jgi:intracellular septation protein
MPGFLKIFFDIGPLIAFFIAHHFFGIMVATAAIVILSILSVYAGYHYEKKIAKVPLLTAIILSFFGLLTLYTGDSTFIKIKPTIINLIFSMILFGGLAFNKGLMKNILGTKITMNHKAWLIFTKRWAYFFASLALLNEAVWRNFSESTWVKFKVFGLLGLTLIFLLSQLSFIDKNKTDSTKSI